MQFKTLQKTQRHVSLALLAALAALTLLIPITPAHAATPDTELAKLTASDGVTDDEFGDAIAISGDTVVVGAYGDESYAGAAYVYVRSGGGVDPTSEANRE